LVQWFVASRLPHPLPKRLSLNHGFWYYNLTCTPTALHSIYNRTPLARTLVIRIANYPDRLGPSGKFVESSTKLTCLQIAGYYITYSPVLWLIEFKIRRGRKV
jgi:hypothetical protein